MDPLEKKRLANERRLKAIQEQKQRNQPNRIAKPTKIIYDSPAKNEKKNNLKLFDSDGEEDDNDDERFRIRPQFEGENGLHLLEMNSEFSSRFKLDERFKEDEPSEAAGADEDNEVNEEKVKNIKILETVLGFGVSEKYPDGKSTQNKRQIKRFDPEDEKASKYLKVDDISEVKEMKPQKKKKVKEVDESKEEIIPISTERYIEVAPHLKDLFTSSSSFSLTSKFQSKPEEEVNDIFEGFNNPFTKKDSSIQKEQLSKSRVTEYEQNKYEAPQKTKDVFESRNAYTFFITGDDSRLKEGVDFFRRPKPLDEIREEWNKQKDQVVETFRMKKRSHARGFGNKHRTIQGKRPFIKK